MDATDRSGSGHVPGPSQTAVIDTDDIRPIDRDEMTGLATAEYGRLFNLLIELGDTDWNAPTVCGDWDVRLMVAHLLGAAKSNASVLESLRQLRRGRQWAKTHGRPEIDGINAVQVQDHQHLSPQQLIEQLQAVAPKAVAGRRKTPGLMRRVKVDNPAGGKMTIGHLMDRVYTRDQWLHRIDICGAVGREPRLTPDHDGRLIADAVEEWAKVDAGPFVLELTGPAGGTFRSGQGGRQLRLDAVEFCLQVSGRQESQLAQIVW